MKSPQPIRPATRILARLGVTAGLGGLIALTWAVTAVVVGDERRAAADRATAAVVQRTRSLSELLDHRLSELDRALEQGAAAWRAASGGQAFGQTASRLGLETPLDVDLLLLDTEGRVVQAQDPSALGRVMAPADLFRAVADSKDNQLQTGSLNQDGAPVIAVLRPLRGDDGSFAGAVLAVDRTGAVREALRRDDLGRAGLIALLSLSDGKPRIAVGPTHEDGSPSPYPSRMLEEMRGAAEGAWTGASALDSHDRVHAFRRLPHRDLVVLVGMPMADALRPVVTLQRYAYFGAGTVSILLLAIGGALVWSTRQARRRAAAQAAAREVLAASNDQLQLARAQADAKAGRLEATLAGMSDGIAMVDADLCLVEWNALFPEIAGIPPDGLRVGMPMENILRVQAEGGQFGPVDAEAEVARRMALLRAGQFGVVERQRPDGRTVELRRKRLPDGGFVTLYSDITERKQAENALREARAAAEAANAAKTRFVAIVSHEIRTPLNALLNTLRLLSDGDISSSQRALIDMASQSGDALFGLINDILEMSRLEAGQLTLRPSLFVLRSLLASAVEMFRAQAASRGITFHIDIADDVPAELFIDPGRLRQVLLNLLSNAVKFARPGEVRVLAAIGGTEGPDRLRLVVRDRGPAIPEQDRGQLFLPFSRLERPGGDDPIGTGLGLAICRHLVGMMGGSIGCETHVHEDAEEGNAFWIDLPLTLAPPHPGAGTPYAAAASQDNPRLDARRRTPRTRILLVEDIAANHVVTATLLRREGHMVDVAETGDAAIRAVRRSAYDLVLMDSFMPGMNGQEATQHIRALPGPTRSLPVLALTANVTAQDEAIFRAAGMDGLLGKPVSRADLLAALDRFVWFGRSMEDSVAQSDDAPSDPDAPVLNRERIAELQGNLPPDVLAGIVEDCIAELDDRFVKLRRVLMSQDATGVEEQAHAMVGVAAGYGLSALEICLRRIMHAARAGDGGTSGAAAVAAVEAELARGVNALRCTVQTVATSNTVVA